MSIYEKSVNLDLGLRIYTSEMIPRLTAEAYYMTYQAINFKSIGLVYPGVMV